MSVFNSTSHQRISTKGRIAILSPLAAANGFIRPWPQHGSLGQHESVPKRHLDRFTRFLHSSPMCPTHRHTDHATSVAVGRIGAMRAMRPNENNNSDKYLSVKWRGTTARDTKKILFAVSAVQNSILCVYVLHWTVKWYVCKR